MNTKKLYSLLLLGTMLIAPSSSGAMEYILLGGMAAKYGKKYHRALLVGATSLYLAGKAHDELYGKKLGFVDISTPSDPKQIGQVAHVLDGEQLTHSVTKRQFDADWYFKYGLVSNLKAAYSRKYQDQVDGVLFSHFWVLLPTARQRLVTLITQLSQDEHEQCKKGNIALVHGTSHGGSILLRTVFDEILRSAAQHKQFVKLRDDAVACELEGYSDVHAYYEDNLGKAPRTQVLQRIPGFGSVPVPGEFITHFDKGPAQKHLLATNLGFFGNNCWWRDGYKESSAEFVTRPSSWGYQALEALIACGQNPFVFLSVARDVYKNPRAITNWAALLDKNFKGFTNRKLMEDTFKEYGCPELYEQYRDELNKMEAYLCSGLVQLFIKQDVAGRWCYLSEQLGIRQSKHSDDLSILEDPECKEPLWPYQARVLLHPEVCNPQNTSMRFYVLGEPEKIQTITTRLYEIAHEVKAYKEKRDHKHS